MFSATSLRQFRQAHGAALLWLLLLNAVFFAPLWIGWTYSMVGGYMSYYLPWANRLPAGAQVIGKSYAHTDQAEFFYPNTVFATQALKNGELPLWEPYTFGGIPVMELGTSGFLYPLRWPLFWLLSPIQNHNFVLVFHQLLATLGMYFLLRLWGTSAAGAVLGAVIWGWQGHQMFWFCFEHVVIAGAWLPLTFLAGTLTLRRTSYPCAVLTGTTMGLLTHVGYFLYAYVGGVIFALWYGGQVLWRMRAAWQAGERRTFWRLAGLPVCSLLVTLALSAGIWLPLAHALPKFHRAPETLAGQLSMVVPFAAVARAWVLPLSAVEIPSRVPDMGSWGLVTLAGLILALLAVFFYRRAVVFYALGVGLVSLGLATGFKAFYLVLRPLLPYFGAVHPYDLFLTFGFAVAVLAAFGLTGLQDARRRNAKWLSLQTALALLALGQAAAFLLAFLNRYPRISLKQWLWSQPLTLAALRLLNRVFGVFGPPKLVMALLLLGLVAATCGVAWKWLRRQPPKHRQQLWQQINTYTIVSATTLALVSFAWFTNPLQPARAEWLYPLTPLIETLQAVQGDRRVLPAEIVLGVKLGAVFGLQSVAGYENLLPRETANFWWTVQSLGKPRTDPPRTLHFEMSHIRLPVPLLEHASVGWLVSATGAKPTDTHDQDLVAAGVLRPHYRGNDGAIFEFTRALPRAFLVPGIRPTHNPLEALTLMASAEFDPRQAALVESDFPPAWAAALSQTPTQPGERRAQIVTDRLNQVVVQAQTPQPALLVLHDSWDESWQVTVDGQPQTIARVNYAFRGVLVPAGEHRLEFRYRPARVLWGLAITALTTAGLLVYGLALSARAGWRRYRTG